MTAPTVPEPDLVEDVSVAEGVTVHTRRWRGDLDHVPFVLVHGLASNARLWDGVAAELAGAGHAVWAVDQRGHGRSTKPESGYDLVTVSDDLARVLDELATVHPDAPVVVGQSWGGNVVIELAARHPGRVRAVACIDGGAIELQRRFASWEECAEVLRPPRLAGTPRRDLEDMLRRAHPDWPESGIQGTLACFAVRPDGTVTPHLDLERHLAILRGLWDHRPADRYPHVRAPVLFVNADVADDAPAEARAWRDAKAESTARAAEALPHARVEWMVGDHDLHAQHPQRVAARLRTFLDDLPEDH